MDTTTSPADHLEPSTGYPLPDGVARWALAALFVVGTSLQAVEFVLENPLEDNAERVAYWADHTTRVAWSMAAGILAVPFLLGGFAVMVMLSRRTSPRLAWSAGVLLTMAMIGLAALHGLELAAFGLAKSGDLTAAVSVLEGEDLGPPGAVMFVMFLAGAALGVLALIAATWRSPLVPRILPVGILAFAVLDFALGYGRVAHLVGAVNGIVLAWAVVIGYQRTVGAGSALKLPLPRSGREPKETAEPPARTGPPA
jgi:hypothetical protein